MFTLLVVQQWSDRRDVGRSFGWKRLSCYEVLFISPRTCMVGRKEACRPETVVHLLRMVTGYPINRLDELLPWPWKAENPVKD
jgi:hypothetical protein